MISKVMLKNKYTCYAPILDARMELVFNDTTLTLGLII